MIRKNLLDSQLGQIIQSLTKAFYRIGISRFRASETFRVIFVGLAVLLCCYDGVSHADEVYKGTKTMGGTADDIGQSVAVDSYGNVYITGSFQQTVDFDPDGVGDSRTAVRSDIFITKINADGSYGGTKTIGGTEDDYGQSVAIDGDGNVYITGSFQQTVDFDPDGVEDSRTAVRSDIFITKINADGSYGGTKTIGGTEDDYGQSVAIDGDGNVYITGSFQQTVDFDPDGSGDSRTAVRSDIFLTKINANSTYGWTKTMGGTADDYGQSVAVHSDGNVYITGSFQQTVDFDPGTGTANISSNGVEDIFLTKINSNGDHIWTRTMGGTDSDIGQSVAVDASGNIFITGSFRGTNVDFDPGTGMDSHSAVLSDIFLTKINANGSYGGTKTMGGTADDIGQSVSVDLFGNVYIAGSFQQTVDFDPGDGTDNFTAAGLADIFLTRINADGSYSWTRTMGGTADDIGQSVAVDSSVNVFVSGSFWGTDVDFDPDGIGDSRDAVLSDIFLTKFRVVGFEVRPTTISTVDGGGTASFTVRLSSEPLSDVTIPVRSSDTTKGTVDKLSLTFTPLDWDDNQTVLVTAVAGNTQRYTIILDPAVSDDTDYNGFDPADVIVNRLDSDSDGGGCFIATAAYGSPMSPHIKLLSQFRDRFLISSETGKWLVHIYYAHSPLLADFIKKHDTLRALVRLGLIPVLGLAWIFLKTGFVVTVGLMLLLVSCFIGFLRRRKHSRFGHRGVFIC